MAAHVRTVQVPEADRRELKRRARDKGAPARVVERARIVLLAAHEVPGKQIAAMVGCAEGTVVTWRGRYAERGLAGLGSPISHATIARIWHRFGVQPWRAETFKFSTDPELEGKI